MKKLGWITVLALAAIACSSGADMIGEMMDSGVPDAGAQDTPVQCNKQEQDPDFETKFIYHWAEFPVTPGVTEVTTCYRYAADGAPPHRDGVFCWRGKANWKQGANIGVVSCGFENEDGWRNKPESITVHD